MPAYIKITDPTTPWRPISQVWVKILTGWRSVSQGWINVAGNWRQFFPGGLTPVIAAQVTIAKSGSGTVTLTGTNRRWTNFASGVYYFNSSTDDTNFSQMDTGSITNPSIGGTNTKTYALTQGDVTANTTNYYQFAVAVTSSTPITSTSTSTSVTVEGTRDITDLSSSSVSTTSVTLSWTASQYAGSQVVQYKQSSSSTWIDHSTQTGATTSTLILGLVGGL
jgi:autotransporter-associated beta strand protein